MTVEYVPATHATFLNEVFDRLNRNVAKLSRQELRHARYSGDWASAAEDLAEEFYSMLGSSFPRISSAARLQMKDVEYTVQLMVLVDTGPSSTTQDGLDVYYSERDDDWNPAQLQAAFRSTLRLTKRLLDQDPDMAGSRFRNQVDFYSLFGALHAHETAEGRLSLPATPNALVAFASEVDQIARDDDPDRNSDAGRYHFATRSAANNIGSRRTRIEIIGSILRAT